MTEWSNSCTRLVQRRHLSNMYAVTAVYVCGSYLDRMATGGVKSCTDLYKHTHGVTRVVTSKCD